MITGGSRGIGAATAAELARKGAQLSLVGLEPAELERVAGELGPHAAWFEADVTDTDSVTAAVESTLSRFGHLDAVVANAGVASYGTVRTADVDAFTRTIQVNLVGVYRTLYAAIPALAEVGGYALVVSSSAAFTPLPGAAAYAASKAAVESLVASLRLELHDAGIGVGSAHPLWIDTDMVRGAERSLPTFAKLRSELPWPANGTTSVQECAEAIADAVARRRKKVYVPRNAVVLSMLRPLLLSGSTGVIGRRLGMDLHHLDDENQALGATWH
jgi:NAD(P)-dependent dehydrogenase (short-subunit alcohol dehydrogenase family)